MVIAKYTSFASVGRNWPEKETQFQMPSAPVKVKRVYEEALKDLDNIDHDLVATLAHDIHEYATLHSPRKTKKLGSYLSELAQTIEDKEQAFTACHRLLNVTRCCGLIGARVYTRAAIKAYENLRLEQFFENPSKGYGWPKAAVLSAGAPPST